MREVGMAAGDGKGVPDDTLKSASAGRPGGASAAWSAAFAEAGTAWIGLLIRLALVVVGLVAVFSPGSVPILKRFGLRSSEINILGSKLTIVDTALSSPGVQLTDDGKLVIGGLEASQVPDRIAQLEQTVKNQTNENANLKATVQDLRDLVARTKSQLDEANTKSHSLFGDPAATASFTADLDRLTAKADSTLKVVDETASHTADVLHNVDASRASGFGVVFGADSKPERAADEIRKARAAGVEGLTLYVRQGSWRSVAVFASQAAAAAALLVLKRQNPTAYLVDLSKWCPLTSPQQAQVEGVPQEDCGF